MDLGLELVAGRMPGQDVEDGFKPLPPGFELITRAERMGREIVRCHCLLRLLAEGIAVRSAAPKPKTAFGTDLRARYAAKLSACQLYSEKDHVAALACGAKQGDGVT
jgi:hypothetical protein